MFTLLSFLGGLMFLGLGGNLLVRGTAGIAQNAKISQFIIGLVVVAFGTSTPQLFTAVQAGLTGAPGMALATAVGASIFNIFITLGIVALSGGAVHLNIRLWTRGSLPLALISAIVAAGIAFFTLNGLSIPRWLGFSSLLLLALYVYAANAYDHKHPIPLPLLKQNKNLPSILFIALIIAGIFALVLGANLLVDSATQISTNRGISPIIMGLTVLAIGTALPQLAASFTAFRDKQHTLLLNNLIGNTIFNLLGICGLLLAIQPVRMTPGTLLTSFIVLAAAATAFLIFTHPAMRRFKRAEAILFIMSYGLYLAYLIHSL